MERRWGKVSANGPLLENTGHSTVSPFIPSILAPRSLVKYVSAWVPSTSERPWELKQGWRPGVGGPDSGHPSCAAVAPNSGFALQWLSHYTHPRSHPLRNQAVSHWEGGTYWARMAVPGPPPSWADFSTWDLQITCKITGVILVTALSIIVSLLMGNPLRVQAEWTAVHHFPFDPGTGLLGVPYLACPGLSYLIRALIHVLGLPVLRWDENDSRKTSA